MQTVAAIAFAHNEPLQIETLDIDAPRADEVLVQIAGVGICHTDVALIGGAAEHYPFPAVFGHEGAGTVAAIGGDVTKVAVGDAVVVTFRSCGQCDHCTRRDTAYCRDLLALNYTGRRRDGSSCLKHNGQTVSSNFFGQSSFAAHALSYEQNLVKVATTEHLALLGPLGCSVQTGVGAVTRSLRAGADSTLLITGGGAVGLSAVMGAKLQSCREIIVVEPHRSRRQLARRLGATHCLDPAAAGNLTEAVRAIVPLGVDNALDTTGIPDVLAAALASLGSRGTLGVLGVSPPDTPLPGDLNTLMSFGQSIRGIIEGDSDPDVFIPQLLAHHAAGRLPFDEMIRTYRLSQINTALEDQRAGRCIKAVLIPD